MNYLNNKVAEQHMQNSQSGAHVREVKYLFDLSEDEQQRQRQRLAIQTMQKFNIKAHYNDLTVWQQMRDNTKSQLPTKRFTLHSE